MPSQMGSDQRWRPLMFNSLTGHTQHVLMVVPVEPPILTLISRETEVLILTLLARETEGLILTLLARETEVLILTL